MPDLPFDRHPIARFAHGLNRFYALAYQGLRVENPCPVPREGPAILICNHVSGLDPFLLQATCPRVIRWLIAKEYFDIPVTKGVARRLGYLPVARKGRDSASLKAGLRALDAGQVVGVFPEGKINDRPQLGPFHAGVALMAVKAGAPIVPAYVDVPRYSGMLYPFLDPPMTRVRFGEPFFVDGDLAHATERMSRAVAGLERGRPRFLRGPRGLPDLAQVLERWSPMKKSSSAVEKVDKV